MVVSLQSLVKYPQFPVKIKLIGISTLTRMILFKQKLPS